MKVWTKDEIKDLMTRRNDCLYTFLIKVYEQQTAEEQAIGETRENNGMGFNGLDADILSSFARFYLQRGYLTEKQTALCRKKMMKYANQITKLANRFEETREA